VPRQKGIRVGTRGVPEALSMSTAGTQSWDARWLTFRSEVSVHSLLICEKMVGETLTLVIYLPAGAG
jgi:hypothetical protein